MMRSAMMFWLFTCAALMLCSGTNFRLISFNYFCSGLWLTFSTSIRLWLDHRWWFIICFCKFCWSHACEIHTWGTCNNVGKAGVPWSIQSFNSSGFPAFNLHNESSLKAIGTFNRLVFNFRRTVDCPVLTLYIIFTQVFRQAFLSNQSTKTIFL